MPELVEQMYCSQQIVIPPKFPYVLKRYCKAAIKTQPYDLLRWSFEYFKALAEHRPPPVKLRLEYPIYSTEGGLTRGCLKVLAQQLSSQVELPIPLVKNAWRGFCLDPCELQRVLCLCEVYRRANTVPFLHFIAVAGGLLTKCLTHTMILLCESLTKEPDGGSAAISLDNFLVMYNFLAKIDASKDVKYYNGFRGQLPEPEEPAEEEVTEESKDEEAQDLTAISSEESIEDTVHVQRLSLIDDHVSTSTRISTKMTKPIIGRIQRSPSVEREQQIERENYMRDRKGRPLPSEEVEKKLKQLSSQHVAQDAEGTKPGKPEGKDGEKDKDGKKDNRVDILVYDEDENPVEYEIYGEPEIPEFVEEDEAGEDAEFKPAKPETPAEMTQAEKIALFVAEMYRIREERVQDLQETFEDIAALVKKFNSANYDLGMVAGRQMSTTSGEFIVQHIEKEIMDYIDEQIGILPDPDLKKKKAKPEEVAMVRDILETFLDENMDIIVPEVEEVEEEEQPLPEITVVYAVPGIGPPVEPDIIADFEDYALNVSKVQAYVIMPRNLRHFLCPPLEKYIEYSYDNKVIEPGTATHIKLGVKKEEAAVGGAMTD
ncbi:uncharacterized protein LOC142984809 isoform X1 [Anticarsia gemmatalis]|uniref:uncharacterized protein LOC142984809 isoform X1 n=1 Tax=Anticarsia gemmatalis TaxID=129554 RepID=UPI003F76B163